jgi:hypothetical protein
MVRFAGSPERSKAHQQLPPIEYRQQHATYQTQKEVMMRWEELTGDRLQDAFFAASSQPGVGL